MSDRPFPISPVYHADLRRLVKEAFLEPAPVPSDVVPHGTIRERVMIRPASASPRRVAFEGLELNESSPLPVHITSADEYWRLALPHRLIVMAPLLDLAELDIAGGERIRLERRLLALYYRQYRCVLLPPHLLASIREYASNESAHDLPDWLDEARRRIMAAGTLEVGTAIRQDLRLQALRRGVEGTWAERTVALAEVMTDVLLLSRAGRGDVKRARSLASSFGGSMALALDQLSEEADTDFERILPSLVRPPLTEDDLPEAERDKIVEYARARLPQWSDGVLDSTSAGEGPSIKVREDLHVRINTRKVEGHDSDQTAREQYQQIRRGLEEHIFGRADLCRHLSLAGVAHLSGVTHQRMLLVGPTGSGKTHAARTLARVLGRPFLQIDMAEVTQTGWHGLDMPIILAALARQASGRLDGAVLLCDEMDKVRVGADARGPSLEFSLGVQASLLALLDGQPVTPDTGHLQMETAGLLVIGTGAFGGEFAKSPPSTDDLVRWGWMPELAARWGERLCLSPPDRLEALELLRSSERSVGRRLEPLTRALGIPVEVPEEVLSYVADHWLRTGADYRSAAEWIITAARLRLIHALDTGSTAPIMLAPDDIVTPHVSEKHRRRSR